MIWGKLRNHDGGLLLIIGISFHKFGEATQSFGSTSSYYDGGLPKLCKSGET